MAIDNIGVVAAESARIVAALDAARDALIPWSDDWTVAACARHIGAAHHVVAEVVRDRPTADFSSFESLDIPGLEADGLGDWVAEGTAALVSVLSETAPDAECWSWWPPGTTAGFWQRRMAQETLVHRWDVELGSGISGEPMNPDVAADGVDEYLDVFAGMTRQLFTAPAGPSFHLHATDTEGEWLIELPAEGERVVTREHAKGDVALRGPAEGLLLLAWGRVAPEAAGVEVIGDATAFARWRELFPPMRGARRRSLAWASDPRQVPMASWPTATICSLVDCGYTWRASTTTASPLPFAMRMSSP
jgi:uncharacterized protein (TIGR03083 family)